MTSSETTSLRLESSDLREPVEERFLDFETTSEVTADDRMIGQNRALSAINFALNQKKKGFNLYVAGPTGTGRNESVKKNVESRAAEEDVPEDVCYIYNFDNPHEPRAIRLPAGKGCEYERDLEKLVQEIEPEIRKAFSSEKYEKYKKEVTQSHEKEIENLRKRTEEFAESKNIRVKQTIQGVMVMPVRDGKALSEEEYSKMSDDQKQEIDDARKTVYDRIEKDSRKIKEIQRDMNQELKKLDKKIGLYSIGHLIDELKEQYSELDNLADHLENIKQDLLENLNVFKQEESSQIPGLNPQGMKKESILNRYKVNLFVDNCEKDGAPVIFEHDPTYNNLIGHLEYRAQFGVLSTDFTMIKAGSLHKAHGGYLVIRAEQILRDYFAWDGLKKALKHREIQIQHLSERYGFAPTTGLKPKPTEIELTVILIGSPMIYHLLYVLDEDFRKLFKVKADFDATIKKRAACEDEYIRFIVDKSNTENFLPFHNTAVKQLLEYSSRMAEHKERYSARFSDVVDIMSEADFLAREDNAENITGGYVHEAIEKKKYRSNMIEEKIMDMFEENTILIDVTGRETGQVNGISVLDIGDYMFGKPSRITARTYLGRGDVVNIEREAKMSGKIHSKGILILTGYLGERFAQDKPLALSASICFEQSYQEVEGDSASSAELYCLLSSLADVPIRQNLAVTGSVDQRGRIQPVGGINEKIEGFFTVCKLKGFSDSQGVVIPKKNVKNLMLKDAVLDAVEKGYFHIYAIETIEEGIELLTGMPAGQRTAEFTYPQDTLFARVDSKLRKYAAIITKMKQLGTEE